MFGLFLAEIAKYLQIYNMEIYQFPYDNADNWTNNREITFGWQIPVTDIDHTHVTGVGAGCNLPPSINPSTSQGQEEMALNTWW